LRGRPGRAGRDSRSPIAEEEEASSPSPIAFNDEEYFDAYEAAETDEADATAAEGDVRNGTEESGRKEDDDRCNDDDDDDEYDGDTNADAAIIALQEVTAAAAAAAAARCADNFMALFFLSPPA